LNSSGFLKLALYWKASRFDHTPMDTAPKMVSSPWPSPGKGACGVIFVSGGVKFPSSGDLKFPKKLGTELASLGFGGSIRLG